MALNNISYTKSNQKSRRELKL